MEKDNQGATSDVPSLPVSKKNPTETEDNVLARTLALPQFRIPEPRVELGNIQEIGVAGWLGAKVIGRAFGVSSLAGAEAVFLNRRLVWPWLIHAAATMPLGRRFDPELQLVILRTVYNAGGVYEWRLHFHGARLGGVSPETVERVTLGPDAEGWTERQRAVLRAVDELQAHRCVSDETWATLSRYLNNSRFVELCAVIGLYDNLAMVFNSIGLRPEAGPGKWGFGAITRKSDDSDAIFPARVWRFNKAVTYRITKLFAGNFRPYGLLLLPSVGDRQDAEKLPVLCFKSDHYLAVPLLYGDKIDWVRELLENGGEHTRIKYRGADYSLLNPRILDSTQTEELHKSVRAASRIGKVLVVDILENDRKDFTDDKAGG